MDDFVLDWTDSFAFKNPDIETGYFYRTGMATRKDVTFVPTPSNISGDVAMIQIFAEVAASSKPLDGLRLPRRRSRHRNTWMPSGWR